MQASMNLSLRSENLRFPGQYYDSETGLHYNYYRDYDPSTGRYIQSDPIGLAGGLNSYIYAGDDPILLIDPQGMSYFNPKGWEHAVYHPSTNTQAGYGQPPPPTCDGEWKRIRWTRDFGSVFTLNCTCWWTCYSCAPYGTATQYPNMGQHKTSGKLRFTGRLGVKHDPKAGDDCMCGAPSTHKGCDTCD